MMSDRLKLTTGKTEFDFTPNVFLGLHMLCSKYMYIMSNHIYTYIQYMIYIYIYIPYIYIIDVHIMYTDIQTI